MPTPRKHTFYPDPIVADALKDAPPKKLSERVNQLIRGGLEREREEAIRAEYARADREYAKTPKRRSERDGASIRLMAAESLFDPDDSKEGLF